MAKPKKKTLPSSSIVTQANELVSARYILPVAEQRLVLTMISRIQPDDEDFKPYRISVGELADFLGVSRGSAYNECKKITENLLTRVVKIEEPGRLLQTGWVSSAEYIDGSGTVKLSFDPLLKPYLLQLKGNFTSCKLEMVLSFKSQYTMRIYTLLKQNYKIKQREFELKTFREILGLRDDQHKEYKHLKSNIIIPVQKEISEKSDLTFEFEEIKYGRQVGALSFRIFLKEPKKSLPEIENINQDILPPIDINPLSDINKLIDLVLIAHKSKKSVQTTIITYEKKYGFEYVKRNILYSNTKAEKSYVGFLNNALRNDWGVDWSQEQKETNKNKPVEIWKRQGFKTQKEYDDYMYKKQMESYGQKHIINS